MSTIVLSNRFSPGAFVQLLAAGPPVRGRPVLRAAAGAPVVATAVADEHGTARFDGVRAGAELFAVGLDGGVRVELRCSAADDHAPTQPPLQPDRRHEPRAPGREQTEQSAGRAVRQEDVRGVVQASDTRTGQAAPIDPQQAA